MSSETSASPEARRARIALRVGSASAAKTELKRSTSLSIAIQLYCHLAMYKSIDFPASPAAKTCYLPRSQSGYSTLGREGQGSDRIVGQPEVIQKRAWSKSMDDLLEADFWPGTNFRFDRSHGVESRPRPECSPTTLPFGVLQGHCTAEKATLISGVAFFMSATTEISESLFTV